MKIGEVFGGFALVGTTPVEEIPARVHLFRHEKTGAELVWVERNDKNKTFAIAFQTIPEDDTGVFHILEHSVLCGSAKYPVKEPFVELLKGSLNTFLNAMTFPDKTMYPVASRNDADFRNLMRVYLDAVFHPAIYENENIFLQEGWHYELDNAGEPRCVGVVFGEMTGVFSSVDEVITTGMLRLLFPDNCYGCVYGGDPEHIPELTYEKFLEAHRRFYHPSNARIFLDGELDIQDILAEIDRDYLSKYERREPDFAISEQKELPYRESTVTYAVTPDEQNKQRAHFAMGRIVGDWRDPEKSLALLVLRDVLTGSNSAPLTRAVLEAGLGQDVHFDVEEDMAQSFALLQVRNTSEEKLPGMRQEIRRIAEHIIEQGLDKAELAASLNRVEFLMSERQEPYGVNLAILASRSWMHGGDPTLYLRRSAAFRSLREKLGTTYFEDLLAEVFLPDDGLAVLNVLPSETLEAETAQRQQKRLHEMLDALGADGRKALEEKAKALALWHQTPDSAQALACIPHLSLRDVPEEPLLTKVGETDVGGVRVLRPEVGAQKTAYLDLYFALPDVQPETLSAASFLTGLLLELPTKHRSATELQRAVKTDLGRMDFAVDVYSRPGEANRCTPYFRASVSVLEPKLNEAVALLGEVLTETEFDHPDKVEEIAKQCLVRQQQNMIMAGHSCAMRHALAGQTAEGAALERVGGYAYFDWLRSVCANPGEAFPSLGKAFAEICGAFTAANLTISAAGNVSDELLRSLCGSFPAGEKRNPEMRAEQLAPANDAIVIPAGVGYAVKAADLGRICERVPGSMALASKLLSLDYLWNEVRVQGGAYGAGMNMMPNGSLFAYSYRDPNPARTLGIFDGAAEYLQRCHDEKKELEQLIIGAVSDSEPLRSAHEESLAAAARVLRGITDEQKRAERRELLATTSEDLLECRRILKEAAEYSSTCVVAGEALTDACTPGFDRKLWI